MIAAVPKTVPKSRPEWGDQGAELPRKLAYHKLRGQHFLRVANICQARWDGGCWKESTVDPRT